MAPPSSGNGANSTSGDRSGIGCIMTGGRAGGVVIDDIRSFINRGTFQRGSLCWCIEVHLQIQSIDIKIKMFQVGTFLCTINTKTLLRFSPWIHNWSFPCHCLMSCSYHELWTGVELVVQLQEHTLMWMVGVHCCLLPLPHLHQYPPKEQFCKATAPSKSPALALSPPESSSSP